MPTNETSGWPYEPREPEGAAAAAVEQRPMACKLTPETLDARIEEIRRELVPDILEVESIRDGRVYWFARSDAQLRKVFDFVQFESGCCDFLDFGIGLCAGGDRISLRVTGPRGAAGFLQRADEGQIPSATTGCGCG